MLLQDTRPSWQANYKSMSPEELVAELGYVAKHAHLCNDVVERKAFIVSELVKRGHAHTDTIILME